MLMLLKGFKLNYWVYFICPHTYGKRLLLMFCCCCLMTFKEQMKQSDTHAQMFFSQNDLPKDLYLNNKYLGLNGLKDYV